MPPGDNRAGEKPSEFWILTFREIIERAIAASPLLQDIKQKTMCNFAKPLGDDEKYISLSKAQHDDLLERIDRLVQIISGGLKALYIAVAIVVGMCLIQLGVIVIGVTAFLNKNG